MSGAGLQDPGGHGPHASGHVPPIGPHPLGQLFAGQAPGAQNPGGWYPDPTDPRGLRYWDGAGWTDHRAQLSAPAPTAAVCSCGVVATGSCRVCGQPFCRAHIAEQPREDRAYLRRWEAWTCGGCIEQGRRSLREEQLERCEAVAPHLAGLGKMRRVRTYTGLRPRKVNLFERSPGVNRPPRAAQAYLIEYDAGEEHSTYQGLAISADGITVYDVGVPMVGVKSARLGPKRGRSGYHLRRAISIEALRAAAAAPTEQTWFEYASRAYLRAAKRLMIEPVTSAPPSLAIVDTMDSPDEPTLSGRPDQILVGGEANDVVDIADIGITEVIGPAAPDAATAGPLGDVVSAPPPAAARSGSRRSRRAAAR